MTTRDEIARMKTIQHETKFRIDMIVVQFFKVEGVLFFTLFKGNVGTTESGDTLFLPQIFFVCCCGFVLQQDSSGGGGVGHGKKKKNRHNKEDN